jgi:RNA polymerase sigma-70 factor (ECF subfamily)
VDLRRGARGTREFEKLANPPGHHGVKMVRTIEKSRKQPDRLRPDEPTDAELLLRYRDRGDQGAFDELVHRYERELYSYLRRYTGDASLAEDVFQATFLQVHLKSHLFEEGRRVRPWLYTIATHQAIDAMRRAGRHQAVSLDAVPSGNTDTGTLINLLSTDESEPLPQIEAEEWRQHVRASVEQLPNHLRVVVLLIYYQGLKYRDAAEILDIPVGTVKSRLHAAIVKLRETWKEQVLPESDKDQ